MLLKTCIQNTQLGQDLLDLVLDEHPPIGVGIGKLLHGTRRINSSAPLVEQCPPNNVELQFVWQSISEEQQEKVIAKMVVGSILVEDDVDVRDSITKLRWTGFDLRNTNHIAKRSPGTPIRLVFQPYSRQYDFAERP